MLFVKRPTSWKFPLVVKLVTIQQTLQCYGLIHYSGANGLLVEPVQVAPNDTSGRRDTWEKWEMKKEKRGWGLFLFKSHTSDVGKEKFLSEQISVG